MVLSSFVSIVVGNVVDVWRHILETSVMEREFVEQLHELNHKINFVKEQSFKDARSCLDVKDVLDKLKIKVSFLFLVIISSLLAAWSS